MNDLPVYSILNVTGLIKTLSHIESVEISRLFIIYIIINVL